MAEFNFVELSKELDSVEETGVSFAGKTNNWDSAVKVKDLVDEIDKCSKLVYLDLEGNTLGVDAAKEIGKALEKHPEFKKALWKDLFTGRLKTEIPQALKYLGQGLMTAGAQLTVLDCSDNALGPNGMLGLEDLIRSPSCYSLQELKLNNCGLGIGGGKMLAKALLDCHRKSCDAGTPLSLKVFIAGRNRLENEGAKALGKVFATIGTLEEVSMPQNGIYHEGISGLSEGFKENENMRVLNLNDNTIRAKGAASLAEAIYSMQKLREINFGDCLLKTKGAVILADVLQEAHEDLQILNLGFNEIGPDGGMAVAAAMQNKLYIRSVILSGNQFGSDGRVLVQKIMDDTPNAQALGSFSDDESVDEEEEEDDSDENSDDDDDEEEEEEDDDVSTEEVRDEDNTNGDATEHFEEQNYSLNSTTESSFILQDKSVAFVGEESRPNTVETFCSTPNPSLKLFDALAETDKLAAFRSLISLNDEDNRLILLVFTALKCAALSQQSIEAMEIAQSLYADAFEYAQKTNQNARVKNFFLIQLGLLKCEEKSFKPSYNLNACRNALKLAFVNKTFPEDVKVTFNLFLDRFS